MSVLRVLGCGALVVGAVLTALNLYGLGAGVRQGVSEPRLTPPPGKQEWASASLFQRRGEPDEEYFHRLTMSVHYRITHSDEKFVVPPHENWLLSGASLVVPSYRDYEFADYRRAIARSAGLCTQFAAAIFDILKRQGFRRRVFEFVPHTVVAARTRRGRELILDGDFGLVVPHSMAAIRRNPAIVRRYYGALDPSKTMFPKLTRERLAATGERAYSGPTVAVLATESTPHRATAERIAYVVKWPLPIALALVGLVILVREQRRHRAAA